MTKAAIYCRISQDHTGEQLGVTRQREDCAALAASLGWEVAGVYVDNDVSATSGKPRPEYRRMLDDIRAGRVDALVAWHADRLYRRMVDLMELLEVVQAAKVPVATVKAGSIDLSSPTGQMIAEILASVAQYEGRAKADRWSRSWRQGREAGKPARTGSRLFGYTRDGEVIEAEAEIARKMASDHLAGVPILQIAQQLERDGVLTTRGSVWRTGTVRQYLANPRIAGFSTLKGEVVAEGTWEPILDRDTWEALSAVLTSRQSARPPRVALLGGLVFCGKCGHRLISGKARNGRTYRCPKRPGMPGCAGVSIYAEPVEDIVEGVARERLADPLVMKHLSALQAGPGTAELLGEVASLEARIVELEAQLEEPGVPVQRILLAVDKLRTRLQDRQAQLAEAVRANAATAYAGGLEWPTDLAQRRELVTTALAGRKVVIAPVGKIHNVFDPRRVQIPDLAPVGAGSPMAR